MPTANRVLVYMGTNDQWEDALRRYKEQGWVWTKNLFTRKERCYKGTENCISVWTESEKIAADYAAIGIENDLGR